MFSELFDKLFKRAPDNSRNEVKQRLQLLLAHDRADITPQILEKIRREIVEVVSKYVEIDDEGLEFMLESDQRLSALVVNFPILRIRNDLDERQPVKTTDAPITLDRDGGIAAEAEAEAAAIAAAENFEKKTTKKGSKQAKSQESKSEEPPPEVKIELDDDIPANMNLDLDAGLGSTPASE